MVYSFFLCLSVRFNWLRSKTFLQHHFLLLHTFPLVGSGMVIAQASLNHRRAFRNKFIFVHRREVKTWFLFNFSNSEYALTQVTNPTTQLFHRGSLSPPIITIRHRL